jgi:hypothetical protein
MLFKYSEASANGIAKPVSSSKLPRGLPTGSVSLKRGERREGSSKNRNHRTRFEPLIPSFQWKREREALI